jgi:hypothetical protein
MADSLKYRLVLKVLLVIVGLYVTALLPALVWPKYMDSPVGILLALPYLSVYLFHSLGVPGLLEHAGACGWGWCKPTWFGLAFIAVFWLGLALVLASVLASLTASAKDKGQSSAEASNLEN